MAGSELAFDENCLILAGDDELQVISRAKTTILKSRNLGRLHRRLSEHICGRYNEEAILASVSVPQRASVERYLTALRGAGAIRDAEPIRGRIIFLSADRIARRLLGIKARSNGYPSVYVAVDSADPRSPSLAADNKRLARWLHSIGDQLFEGRCTTVYRLQPEPLRLSRELVINGPESIATIPRQLRLVKPADVSQLPLVCLKASHWLFPGSVSRFGLSHEEVERELIREFVIQIAEARTGLTSAKTLQNLRAAALDRAASSLPPERRTKIDLFEEPDEHPQVAYLKTVLRSRLRNLPGVFTQSGGFFAYEFGRRRSCSLLRVKALRDVLLEVVRHMFYGPADAQHETTPQPDYETFATSGELRRLLDEVKKGRQPGPNLVYRRIRCWGITAYYARSL